MSSNKPLIPEHGGYRKLKSFQVAQLAYDVTVRFCDIYVDKHSRTRDQMVQAARSGVQNIAEGSLASGISKKTELKLTNVARASLEELRLDYEDFLRQRGLPMLSPSHPAPIRFKSNRCASLQDMRAWAADEMEKQAEDTHGHSLTSTDDELSQSMSVLESPRLSLTSSTLVANAALSLLNLACHLLDRQLAAQAKAFEEEGGFTERLYRVHSERRREKL